MKIALCFIISYDHTLNKENIWIEWINKNKDIINVYFHYKDYNLITSEWIKKHAIPQKYISDTTYLHMVSAYMSLMNYAIHHDKSNTWFCFLTDACVPIITPLKFREMFFKKKKYSIMSWKPAYWNVNLSKRGNLRYFKKEYHIANTPWFILNKEHAICCFQYSVVNSKLFKLICSGEIANENIFAIILYSMGRLNDVINEETTATDWSRMMTPTSPYLFTRGDVIDQNFINDFLLKNKYTVFLRKVDKKFPDDLLLNYIKKDDNNHKLRDKVFWLQYRWFFKILTYSLCSLFFTLTLFVFLVL
jgi:hypothetical protein